MGTQHRQWVIRSTDDLGRAVADVRASRGLTQQELADHAAVQRTFVAKLEAGHLALAGVDRILRILRRMGAEVTISLRRDGG